MTVREPDSLQHSPNCKLSTQTSRGIWLRLGRSFDAVPRQHFGFCSNPVLLWIAVLLAFFKIQLVGACSSLLLDLICRHLNAAMVWSFLQSSRPAICCRAVSILCS